MCYTRLRLSPRAGVPARLFLVTGRRARCRVERVLTFSLGVAGVVENHFRTSDNGDYVAVEASRYRSRRSQAVMSKQMRSYRLVELG